MALSTTQYGYIIDPMVPFTDGKGNTIKDGFVRVFVAGSSTPVITYRNFDGAANQDLIELDNSGRTKTSVIGSKGITYKVCVYDQLHSQESPILTVDKVSVIGANITAGTGATVVMGLDGLTTKPDGFVDASVIGTDGYVALDHTLVDDDLNTDAKVTAVEEDRYIPLLNDDVNDPDSKITLGRLWQWVLGKIKSLSTTITTFRSGDVIPVDGPNGTAKMSKDDLLRATAENAVDSGVAASAEVLEEQVEKIAVLENAVDSITDSQINEKTVIPELNIIGGAGWVKYGEVGTQLTYRSSTSLDYGYFVLDVTGAESVFLRFVTALKNNSSDSFGVYAVATDENDIILECWTKTFSGATSGVGSATCTIPQGSKKLYVNLAIVNNTNGRCTAFITSEVTEYGPAGVVDIADASHSYETQSVSYSVMDYGVNPDAELGSDLNYTHTEIQVLKGEKYLISGGSYWWYPLYVFKPGSSIYYLPTAGAPVVRVYTDVAFEVPYDGTLYVNLNADDTNVRDGASIRKIVSESDAWALKKKIVNQDNLSNELISWIQSQSSGSVLAGKKVYDCGDSVMRGAGTGTGHQISEMEQLAAICAFDLTHNAVSGFTLGYKDGDSSKSIVQKMIADLTAVTDYDYVVFQGGFNDLSHTQTGEITPVGTTSFDASTTLGALETICYWFVNNYSDAKILFILDHKWYGMRAHQPTLWEKMVEVLEKWSVPYVDIYGKTPMNGINHTVRDKWYYFDGDHGDGLHPNTAAYTHFYLGPVKSAMESL